MPPDEGTPRITLVLSGGGMGHDPRDPLSWSGSALHLVSALERRGALADAYGLRLPPFRAAALAARRPALNREGWRRRLLRSQAYRDALTGVLREEAARRPAPQVVLQLGAYAQGPSVFDAPVLTYQDGSAAAYASSPYASAARGASAAEALRYERRLAREAACVLTTSAWLAGQMSAAYGLAPGRARSVGLGVARRVRWAPSDHDYAAPRLLFVGVEFERKGGPELLAAFARVRAALPAAELHLVGPRRLPAGADAPGVTWHGYLGGQVPAEAERFDALLRDCSLFVLPSRYEPFGLAPIEAMANGLPAVVTDAWALAENVRDRIDGLRVPPGDPEALAKAVLDLLADPAALRAMGEAAAATPALVGWDAVAGRIVEAAAAALRAASEARIGDQV